VPATTSATTSAITSATASDPLNLSVVADSIVIYVLYVLQIVRSKLNLTFVTKRCSSLIYKRTKYFDHISRLLCVIRIDFRSANGLHSKPPCWSTRVIGFFRLRIELNYVTSVDSSRLPTAFCILLVPRTQTSVRSQVPVQSHGTVGQSVCQSSREHSARLSSRLPIQ